MPIVRRTKERDHYHAFPYLLEAMHVCVQRDVTDDTGLTPQINYAVEATYLAPLLCQYAGVCLYGTKRHELSGKEFHWYSDVHLKQVVKAWDDELKAKKSTD